MIFFSKIRTWEPGPVLGNLDLNRSLVWNPYSGTWTRTREPGPVLVYVLILFFLYSFMYSNWEVGPISMGHTVQTIIKKTFQVTISSNQWYSKLHFIESLAILCYICSNGSIIRNISFEDFIANIAMDIPSSISL